MKNSKASELLKLEEENLDPWMSLMVTMIYEFLQGGASKWEPYFRVLPTHFDTLMFWTEDELRELQGSVIVDKIGKADADNMILDRVVPLISQHSNLFPLPDGLSSSSPDGKTFLLSLAHRMGSLIMAYAFDIGKGEDEDDEEGEDGYLTDDEEQLPKGMVPLADILNADADRNNVMILTSSVRCLVFANGAAIGSAFPRGRLLHYEVHQADRCRRANIQRLWRDPTGGFAATIWLCD